MLNQNTKPNKLAKDLQEQRRWLDAFSKDLINDFNLLRRIQSDIQHQRGKWLKVKPSDVATLRSFVHGKYYLIKHRGAQVITWFDSESCLYIDVNGRYEPTAKNVYYLAEIKIWMPVL